MAKYVALLADTHFGVRSDGKAFHANNRRFFSEVFFPNLKQRAINTCIHVGDIFDNRTKIDVETARLAREYFFDPAKEMGLDVTIALGNHDFYYREKLQTTAADEFLSRYKFIKPHRHPVYVDILGKTVAIIPWINRENYQEVATMLDNPQCDYAFGHFELNGYKMSRVTTNTHGQDPVTLSKFKHVYTGHFHHRHTIGNITYLGSTQQHTWADAGDVRGFNILDLDTGHLEFIANPNDMFKYIRYEDATEEMIKNLTGTYVRVTYDKIDKRSNYDAFMRSVQNAGALSVQAVPQQLAIAAVSVDPEPSINPVDDPASMFASRISEQQVLEKMVDLYNKAMLV